VKPKRKHKVTTSIPASSLDVYLKTPKKPVVRYAKAEVIETHEKLRLGQGHISYLLTEPGNFVRDTSPQNKNMNMSRNRTDFMAKTMSSLGWKSQSRPFSPANPTRRISIKNSSFLPNLNGESICFDRNMSPRQSQVYIDRNLLSRTPTYSTLDNEMVNYADDKKILFLDNTESID
jgi:hypothetical protein